MVRTGQVRGSPGPSLGSCYCYTSFTSKCGRGKPKAAPTVPPAGLQSHTPSQAGVCVCKGRQAAQSREAQALGHTLAPVAPYVFLPASRTHCQFGVRRPSQGSPAIWRGPLISNSWGLPFPSIPQPQAEWSPGQSTEWLFATKHLEMPEGSSRLSLQAPSHTVIHTALRRLCQQAWPHWAQLLSLHLQRVQG